MMCFVKYRYRQIPLFCPGIIVVSCVQLLQELMPGSYLSHENIISAALNQTPGAEV